MSTYEDRAPAYGDEHADPPHYVPGETDPLLKPEGVDAEAQDAHNLEHVKDPKATVRSSAANLMNTILGTGMLAMAFAISKFGLYPGLVLLIIAACASAFGLHLLSVSAAKVGRSSSYFNVAALATNANVPGKRAGIKERVVPVIIDFAIAVKCFGVSISYLVVVGNFMPQVLQALVEDPTNPNPNPAECSPASSYWLYDRRIWISIFMLFLGPLSFAKKLDAFKFTSYIALSAVVYLLFVVIYYTARDGLELPPPGFKNADFTFPDSLKALPIFVFAFTCHQNIFSIYNELKVNTKRNMKIIINTSISVCFCIYLVLGIIGYLSFGSKISNIIITNYPCKDIIIIVAKLALTILVSLSYPLQLHPCRRSCDKVVTFGAPSEKWATWRYYIITIVLIAATWGIALANPELDLILSVVGSVGSTTICYTLPGIFYVLLTRGEGWHPKRIAALILFIVGLVLLVVCLTANFIPASTTVPH